MGEDKKVKVKISKGLLIPLVGLAILLLWWAIYLPRAPIELVTVEYPKEVQAGEGFELKLTLKTHRPIPQDCGLFIHLVGMGQFINADVNIPTPTSLWEVGREVNLGPFIVYMPVDAPAGDYEIGSGLFFLKQSKVGSRFIRLFYRNPLMWGWRVGRIKVAERVSTAKHLEEDAGDEYMLSVQSSLAKIFPEKEYFTGSFDTRIELEACRGEYEAAQLVIIPGKGDVDTMFLEASDLILDSGGYVLDKANVELFMVKFVKTKRPYYNTLSVGLWPDPLIPLEQPFNVTRDRVQPIWVRVYMPEDAPSGNYQGEISLIAQGTSDRKVLLKVKVYDFGIGSEKHLKTAFGLKEYMLDKFYHRRTNETDEEWQKRREEICQAYYFDMLAHRLDPIHNIGNPSFLGKEGSEYKLDFAEFDRKARLYLSHGQRNFSVGEYWPWQSKAIWGTWYGMRDAESVLGVFRAYGRHLEENGWLDNAYAYIIDETFHRVKEVTALIHQAHPGIKNLLTMPPNKDYPDIDIWCPRIDDFRQDVAEEFRTMGKDIWTYVAGTTRPYPNLNLDVVSMEYRIIPWILWKYRIDGLLYWSVNCWELSNPWEDAMNFPNQNGDGFLYYPGKNGPVGSIRLEVLRDGLEDYEYLHILSERLKLLKARRGAEAVSLIEEIEDVLKVTDEIVTRPAYYTRDAARIFKERQKIAQLVERLDRVLGEGEPSG